MQRICPVCNGLTNLEATCPYCQMEMDDRGQLESYYGPYEPYEEDELLSGSALYPYENSCQHIAYCAQCGRTERIEVAIVNFAGGSQ